MSCQLAKSSRKNRSSVKLQVSCRLQNCESLFSKHAFVLLSKIVRLGWAVDVQKLCADLCELDEPLSLALFSCALLFSHHSLNCLYVYILTHDGSFISHHHLWKMRHKTEPEIMKCCRPLFIVVASSPLFYGSPSALAKVCLKLFPVSLCSVHFPIYVDQMRGGGWKTHPFPVQQGRGINVFRF